MGQFREKYTHNDSNNCDQIVDAVLVSDKRTQAPWAKFWPERILALVVLLFPLWYGGNHEHAVSLLKIWLFGFSIALLFLQLRALRHVSWDTALHPTTDFIYKRLGALILLFSLLLIVQLIPFSRSLLGPFRAEYYSLVGSYSGSISFLPHRTLSGLFWLLALTCTGFLLYLRPQQKNTTSTSREQKAVNYKTTARSSIPTRSVLKDYTFDVLQNAIILSGVLCSFIAITHWAARSDVLFGLFDPQRGKLAAHRAHWPFINPNHLSALLQIAGVIALARLFKVLHLRSTSKRARKDLTRLQAILLSPQTLRTELSLSLALFTMFICNLLTLSRAGTLLLTLGLIALTICWRKISVHPSPKAPTRSLSRKLLTLAMYSIGLFLLYGLVLIFLGQGGQDLLGERIDFGLKAGFGSIRQLLATGTWKMILSFPLFGVGYGCWNVVSPRYLSQDLAGSNWFYAHNDYLQLLSETGIVGTLIVFIGIIMISRWTLSAFKVTKSRTTRLELAGSSIALLLPLAHAGVDFPFHIPALSLVFVIALSIHLRKVAAAMRPN